MNSLRQIGILTRRLGRRALSQPANRLLGICIILCTCVAASLSLFSSSVQHALQRDISTFLGAPLVVRSSTPILQSIPPINGLEQSVTTRTLTTGAIANQAYQSVSLKGVSSAYPLKGELLIDFGNGDISSHGSTLKPTQAWLDRRALSELNVTIGDLIQIGEASLTVTGEVMFEPDRLTQLQHTLPRVIVSLPTLTQTGTLVNNQRVDHRVLFTGSEQALNQLEAQLPSLIEHNYGVLKPTAGNHPFARVSVRAEKMLNLVLVLILLMCGGAAAMLADYSVALYTTPTAVLRCMGLPRHAVAAALCLQLLLLALAASIIGCLVAWLLQPLLLSLMGPHMELSVAPLRIGDLIGPVGVGLVMVVAFVVPSLQRLTSVSVASVLRNNISVQKRFYLSLICATSVVVAILWLSSDNTQLTIMLVAAVSILILLSVTFGWALSKLCAQAHHLLRGPIKIAVRAIGRSPRRHITPLISVAITMMALLMTVTLRGSFIDALQSSRLEADGNYIFTGLPAEQKAQFMQTLSDNKVELKGLYPILRAHLVEINGVAIDRALKKESDTREQTRSKVRLSWAEHKPENNTLVKGQWPQLGSGHVSVEEEVMSDLGLKLGDTLGFQIRDSLVTAKITSVRKYNGSASSMMFWFMFAPDALQAYQHHYMGGLLLKDNAIPTLRAFANNFAQLRITDLERQISKIRAMITAMTRLMNTTLTLLLSGAVLLIVASSFVGAIQQLKQLGLLRTFGLKRKQGYWMSIVQQLTLGLVACMVGILGVQAIAGLLFQQLFNLSYSVNWTLVLSLSALVSILFTLLGCVFAFKSLRQPVRLSLS